MKNIRLAVKLIGGFICVAMIVLIVGGFGLLGTRNLSGHIEEVGQVRLPSIQSLLEVNQAMQGIIIPQRTLMAAFLSMEERQYQLEHFHSFQQDIFKHWEHFKTLPATAEEERLTEQFDREIVNWRNLNTEWLGLLEDFHAFGILNTGDVLENLRLFRGDHFQAEARVLDHILESGMFEGGDDPTACNFGRWMATVDFQSPQLVELLRQMQVPHNRFHQAVGSIQQALRLGDDSEALRLYRQMMRPATEEVFSRFDELIAMVEQINDLRNRINALVMGPIYQEARQVMDIADELIRVNEHTAAEAVDLAVADATTARLVVVAGMILGVILALGLGGLLTMAITRPVRKGMDYAVTVASGNLNAELEIDQKDEIGTLAVALRTMVVNLKEKIREADEKANEAAQQMDNARAASKAAEAAKLETEQSNRNILQAAETVERVVERMTSASEQLAAQVEQASRGAEEQKGRTGETATAMEEMNATVLEVARNASRASEESDKARSRAQDGSQIVIKAIAAINQVEQRTQAMKNDLATLGRQADQIGKIMNVIDDIADQTNLLALNAAIEAARAGDAGRGFAVVADEVRKLAEKTMNATKEVEEAISAIQEGTQGSIRGMEQAVAAVEEATKLANESGKSLEEIVSLVEAAADQVRSIAAAAEQQSAASEEINRSVEGISRISLETSEVMDQSAQAVSELARQAVELRALVQELKQH